MRVVLYAGANALHDELFCYLAAHVAARHVDTIIVRVERVGRSSNMRKLLRKTRQFGPLTVLRLLTGAPIQRRILDRDAAVVRAGIAQLSRPSVDLEAIALHTVGSANGAASATLLKTLAPDVLVQAGAGILRPPIFQIPRYGALNMHHGIAPLIRGVNSIYWALYENRPEWIGATIHRIDEGIDTGDILAYAPLDVATGARFPELFVRATESGVAALISTLARIERGEHWALSPADGESHYRTSIDGWRLWRLERRQRASRAHLVAA